MLSTASVDWASAKVHRKLEQLVEMVRWPRDFSPLSDRIGLFFSRESAHMGYETSRSASREHGTG